MLKRAVPTMKECGMLLLKVSIVHLGYPGAISTPCFM